MKRASVEMSGQGRLPLGKVRLSVARIIIALNDEFAKLDNDLGGSSNIARSVGTSRTCWPTYLNWGSWTYAPSLRWPIWHLLRDSRGNGAARASSPLDAPRPARPCSSVPWSPPAITDRSRPSLRPSHRRKTQAPRPHRDRKKAPTNLNAIIRDQKP